MTQATKKPDYDFNGKRFVPYSDETSGIGGKYRPTTYGVYDNKKGCIHSLSSAKDMEEAREQAIQLNIHPPKDIKQAKTVLDIAFDEKQAAINKNFLKEWKPFEKLNKDVERGILRHFMRKAYQWQPSHNEAEKKPFKPVTFSQIDTLLGLAYTSSGDYAGKWVCNGGYLWADPTHYFTGFAINELGQVVGIADDYEEKSIYIIL